MYHIHFYPCTFCFVWSKTGESLVFFRSIGESESENLHLARLWREGFPERQLVALRAELKRSGLLLKNTRDSPSPSKELQKSIVCVLYSPGICGPGFFRVRKNIMNRKWKKLRKRRRLLRSIYYNRKKFRPAVKALKKLFRKGRKLRLWQ